MNPIRVLAMVAPFALAATGSAQTVLLRFKPTLGKTTPYTVNLSMSMAGGMMPKPTSFVQVMPLTIRVASRKGTTTTLETKIGQVKMTVPADSPMAASKAQIEKASSNKTTMVTVDELGNLQGMTGGAAAGQMGAMQGVQGVVFPKKAVKVGETWNADLDLGKAMGSMMRGMKMDGKVPVAYKLVSLKGSLATIAMTLKGTTTMDVQGNKMTLALTSKGTIVLDTATGFVKSSTSTTDNNMSMGSMGSMKQHMTMTMTAK